jgi:hypothetical protein
VGRKSNISKFDDDPETAVPPETTGPYRDGYRLPNTRGPYRDNYGYAPPGPALARFDDDAAPPAPSSSETKEQWSSETKEQWSSETKEQWVDRMLSSGFRRPPKTFSGAMEASARGAGQVASRGFVDEAVAGVQAVGLKVIGDERPFWDIYRDKRATYRAGDAKAQAEEPQSFGAGAVGAAFLSGNLTSMAAGPVARVVAGAGEAALSGLGGSNAELTTGDKKEFHKAAVDSAKAGVVGTVLAAPAAAAAVARTPGLAREYKKQLTHDITEGANPVHARRAVSDDGASETIMAWVEKTPDARKGDSRGEQAGASRDSRDGYYPAEQHQRTYLLAIRRCSGKDQARGNR